MSWKIINEILGLAIVDPTFQNKLLASPLSAVQEQGFNLTSEEMHILQCIQTHDLCEFSQRLIEELHLNE